MFVAPTTYHEIDTSRCTFCGAERAGARSREHVFPQWLLRDRGALSNAFRLDWTSVTDEQALGERELTLGSFVAGHVCRRCNNGWMSALEQMTRELLPGLIDAERPLAELSKADREVVARWATSSSPSAFGRMRTGRSSSAASHTTLSGRTRDLG